MIAAKVTHSVFNQGKPLVNYNLLRSDAALQRALKAFGGQNAVSCAQKLDAYGAGCGSEKIITTAELADKNRPVLHQFDRYGHRIDVAEYHPAYHDLMQRALQEGFAGHGFNNNEAGSQVVRAALVYMENQTEAGHCCPLTMTFSAIPALRKYKEYEGWVHKLSHQDYDPRNVPISEKKAVTVGMSMTEKQGGSDVRLNTTIAKPIAVTTEYGQAYALTGHKWFTSAPMSDAFLTLAKVGEDGSPTCFLVPRWMPDGSRNSGFKVMRLKNKLGDHSNASSEVEYDDAFGTMIGERGKGVKTIIEMVQSTRLDCTIGSAATARKALHLAIHHTMNRSCFGARLMEQPLMTNLLADMCVEAEAHALTAMRLARAFDDDKSGRLGSDSRAASSTSTSGGVGLGGEDEAAFFRMGVAIGKYWVTKRLPNYTYEAMEIFGGNGYAEDFPMARIFRSSPLNAIWEGSGNVMCLDILRAAPSALPSLMKEISQARGQDAAFDAHLADLNSFLRKTMGAAAASGGISADVQRGAREIAERLAVALQASLMIRFGDPKAAEVFVASRIRRQGGVLSLGSHQIDAATAAHLIEANLPRA